MGQEYARRFFLSEEGQETVRRIRNRARDGSSEAFVKAAGTLARRGVISAEFTVSEFAATLWAVCIEEHSIWIESLLDQTVAPGSHVRLRDRLRSGFDGLH